MVHVHAMHVKDNGDSWRQWVFVFLYKHAAPSPMSQVARAPISFPAKLPSCCKSSEIFENSLDNRWTVDLLHEDDLLCEGRTPMGDSGGHFGLL